ncbi:uncharacterized protein [Ptychodera flava]|uniref:uncharacterized protein n=1 Tax=Ptychodera flava TaxID=63121 RepID=UPI00396A58EF
MLHYQPYLILFTIRFTAVYCVCIPNTWQEVDGDCFAYFSEPKHWLAAHSDCISRGGTLAKYTSSSQSGMFTDKQSPAWIGVSKRSSGQWSWFNGDSLSTPSLWAAGQPVSDTDKVCVQEDNDGYWLNAHCGEETGYICRQGYALIDQENAAEPAQWLREGTLSTCPYTGHLNFGPAEPFFNPRTGSCYSSLGTAASWSASKVNYCEPTFVSVNSGLLDVEDEDENFVIYAEIVSRSTSNVPWLGQNTRDLDGQVELSDRSTLAQYTNINREDPVDNSKDCFYMSLDDGSTWRRYACDGVNRAVWCKISPITPICSSDATCIRGTCSSLGVCKCEPYWTVDPATKTCKSCSDDRACAAGSCVGGACVCDDPGVPVDPITLACTVPDPVCDDDADCYHGTCFLNSCMCLDGWGKDGDGLCTACLSDARCVHGFCDNGVCNCDDTWWGYSESELTCTAGTPHKIKRTANFRSGLFYKEGDGMVGPAVTPLIQTTASTIIGCASACTANDGCQSFHYQNVDNLISTESACFLFNELLTSSELLPDAEYEYYRVDGP